MPVDLPHDETSKMCLSKDYHVDVLSADVGIVLIDVWCGDKVNTGKELPRSRVSKKVESHPIINLYGVEIHHGIPVLLGSMQDACPELPSIKGLHKFFYRLRYLYP